MTRKKIAPNIIEQAAEEYRALGYGNGSDFVAKKAAEWNVSEGTVRRRLNGNGATKERKKRSDSGRSAITRDHLRNIAWLQMKAVRRTGSWEMPTTASVTFAEQNGLIPEGIHPATWNGALKKQYMSSHFLSRKNPKNNLPSRAGGYRTLYPLHVVEIDASFCLQWKFSKIGKMQFEPATSFYPKDFEAIRAKKKAILRLLATDKHTGMIFVKYFHVSGESAAVWVEFLLDFFYPKERPLENPFYGVPENIYTDAGSGLNSAEVQNLLAALEVNFETHTPGNPRAKGQVESTHGHWQRRFESRLALKRASSLEELNSLAMQEIQKWNSEAILSRAKKTRLHLWNSEIAKMPVHRVLPLGNRDMILSLAHRKPVQRKVDAYGAVSFESLPYLTPAAVPVGETVEVYPCPWAVNTLTVLWNGEKYLAKRIAYNEVGQRCDLPVFGQYRSPGESILDRNFKDIRDTYIPISIFGGADTKKIATIAGRGNIEEVQISGENSGIMTPITAKQQLRHFLGAGTYEKNYRSISEEIDRLVTEFGGVPLEEARSLAERITKESRAASPA